MEQTQTVEAEVPKQKKKKTEGEVPMGVRLSDELRSEVEKVCELEGVPLASFVRDAVEQQVLKNPVRSRQVLLRSLAITAAQFERALQLGALKGTEADDQAEEIRKFFGQFVGLLKGEHKEE